MLLIPTLLCPKSWEGMSGNETQRFCSYCKKHVHNLAALSVSERLALLSSPAASLCSRYRIAIRRPAQGKEDSYHRHLLKHGAGVALAGSALLVLWEMHGEAEKERYYRVVATTDRIQHEMQRELYEQCEVYALGMIALPPPPPFKIACPAPETDRPSHVDLKLDPFEIEKLIDQTRPTIPQIRPAK